MAISFQPPTWTNPPNDNNDSDRAKLIPKVLSEMQAQMKAMRDEVIAAEVSNWLAKSSHRDIKDSGKPPKLKLRRTVQDNPDDQSAEVGFPSVDLKGAFDAMMNTGNQEYNQFQQETSRPSDPGASKPE